LYLFIKRGDKPDCIITLPSYIQSLPNILASNLITYIEEATGDQQDVHDITD